MLMGKREWPSMAKPRFRARRFSHAHLDGATGPDAFHSGLLVGRARLDEIHLGPERSERGATE